MLKKKNIVAGMVRRLLLSWLIAVLLELLLLPVHLRELNTLAGIGKMSLLRVILVTAALMTLLSILCYQRKTAHWERWAMVFSFFAIATITMQASSTWPFLVASLLVFVALTLYALMGWNGKRILPYKEVSVHKGFCWTASALT